MNLKLFLLSLTLAAPVFAIESVSVTIDGTSYSCTPGGSGGGSSCECAVQLNDSRKDYYYQVYKRGTKIYESETTTNTKEPRDSMVLCKSKIVTMTECYQ